MKIQIEDFKLASEELKKHISPSPLIYNEWLRSEEHTSELQSQDH
jgi:hypothetical protein